MVCSTRRLVAGSKLPGVKSVDLIRTLRASRTNFVSIQSSHVIAAKGYHAPYLRTGFESVIAQRTSQTFAYCAKEDGVVMKVNPKGVIVQYKSGKVVGVETGRIFGRSEGSIFPFKIRRAVEEGQKFKKGAPIAFNDAFFEYDSWNPGHLVMKTGLTAKTVLWETKQTHEDASSISPKLSSKLGTSMTYLRNFTVNFEQQVHDVVQQGKAVTPSSILMIIEDEITANLGTFGNQAAATLKNLARQAPMANYQGIIDRIEVFYHGDKDQMSSSIRELAELSDKYIAVQARSTNKPKFTGQVTDDYRVDGTPLGLNKAEIRFYVTTDTGMGVAD